MPIIIQLDVDAPSGVDWPLIPNLPSDFPLSGLAAYFSVDGAALDTNGRVASLPLWYGSGELVQSAAGSAPALTVVNGHDMLLTTIARNDRLIVAPAPAGANWPDSAENGCSFFFPVHVTDNSVVTGLLNAFGFRLRAVNGTSSTTKLQVQRVNGGTQNLDVTTDMTALCVVGFTYNATSGVLRLYKNGAVVTSVTSAAWGALSAVTGDVGVFGSVFNSGTPSAGKFGDLLRYTRAVSTTEAAEICAYLQDKYAIA